MKHACDDLESCCLTLNTVQQVKCSEVPVQSRHSHLAAAAKALSASLCLATSEGFAMSAHALATTSGGKSSAADALLLPA